MSSILEPQNSQNHWVVSWIQKSMSKDVWTLCLNNWGQVLGGYVEHLVASWKVQWDFWPWNLKFPINPMEIDSKRAKAKLDKAAPPKMLQNFGSTVLLSNFSLKFVPKFLWWVVDMITTRGRWPSWQADKEVKETRLLWRRAVAVMQRIMIPSGGKHRGIPGGPPHLVGI